MAVTDESRYRLHQKLEVTLGAEEAVTLMEHLPPVGWADVATRHDLEQSRLLTTRDLDVFTGQLRAEMGELRSQLRGEMDQLRLELRGEMASLSSELRGEMGEMRTGMATLRAEMHRDQRNMVLAMVGSNTALVAVVVAVLRLL